MEGSQSKVWRTLLGAIPANLLLGDILGLPTGDCVINMVTDPNFSKAAIFLFDFMMNFGV
jgi:hypothetical protein